MLISIIVPFYHGNQYLPKLLSNITKIRLSIDAVSELELIIVNDSPDESPKVPIGYEVTILDNKVNCGIQQTRLNGLARAKGDWVVFLDQDDELVLPGFLESVCQAVSEDADLIIGNGVFEKNGALIVSYKNLHQMETILKLDTFISIRNLIVSPGQCLLRRNSIPDRWKQKALKINGADDWLLWILYFRDKHYRIVYNSQIVYKHIDNGKNVSNDLLKMKDSALEMLERLKGTLTSKQTKKLQRAIEFKYLKDSNELRLSDYVKYGDIVLDNLIFKLK